MGFTLLPAVDVSDGRTARVDPGAGATPGGPREAALAWQAGGAAWVHLVDLDAAFGRGTNTDALAAVIEELDIPVELAGGIADDGSLDRALATGAARVVLGTAALDDPEWCARAIATHGERLAVSLDVHVVDAGTTTYRLAARGRGTDGGDLWEALAWLDRVGCARYVVTDVRRDGTLRGPHVELCRAVARATPAPVIASGGIASIDDLVTLAGAAAGGAHLEGAIVGRALHRGRFTLAEALAAVRGVQAPGRS